MVRQSRGLISAALVLVLSATILAMAYPPVFGDEARSAQVLIQNAQRLQAIVYCRNNVIESSLNVTANAELWAEIQNYTSMGDYYLNASIQFYNQGNYTAAQIDAIWSIHYYGRTISLQARLAGRSNVTFTSCTAAALNLTRIHMPPWANATGRFNESAHSYIVIQHLLFKINILQDRLDRIKEIVSNVNATDEELEEINSLIAQAESLLAQARTLLNTTDSNSSIVEVKKILAQVHRILGELNHHLANLGLMIALHRASMMGMRLNITYSQIRGMGYKKAFKTVEENIMRHHMRGMHGPPPWAGPPVWSNGSGTNMPPPAEPPHGGHSGEHGHGGGHSRGGGH